MANSRVLNSWWQRVVTIPKRGKEDGIRGIPEKDAARPSQFEGQLAADGREVLNRLSRDFDEKIQAQEGRLNQTVERFRNHVEKYKIESPAYNARKKELGRDVTKHLSKKWYIIFLLIIVLGEFALNAQAFDVFGKEPWLTYVMALTVAIGLPISAHFIGLMCRQWPKPYLKTGIVLVGSIALLLFCLIGINAARLYFMEMWHPQEVAGLKALQKPFLYINLFVFGCAFIMSYFAHDADSELDNLHRRVVDLDEQMNAADGAIHHISAKLDALTTGRDAEINAGKEIIAGLIYIYRGANERNRTEGTRPAIFDNDPREKLALEPVKESQVAVTQEMIEGIREERRASQAALEGLAPEGRSATREALRG